MSNPSPFLDSSGVSGAFTDAECRTLLATRSFGRVGVTSGGLPAIVAVHYQYALGTITFRTGSRTKLRAAASGDVLAFEVDEYDSEASAGWSVLALGRADVLPGDLGNNQIALHCELLSGGRFLPGPETTTELLSAR